MSKQVIIPTWMQNNKGEWPAWLQETKQKHWQMFSEQGLPDRKQERWKYANLNYLNEQQFSPAIETKKDLAEVIKKYSLASEHAHLLVLINGEISLELSRLKYLPEGVVITSIDQAIVNHSVMVKPYLLAQRDRAFEQANLALFNKGVFIYLPSFCDMKNPLHLLAINTGEQAVSLHARNIIELSEYSSMSFLEEYISLTDAASYQNIVTDIKVDKNARLQHYKIQRENKAATQITHCSIKQHQDSQVVLNHYANGAYFARDDIKVDLLGAGATCQSHGFYKLSKDKQYIDYHLDFNHLAANTNSRMLYKGVLDGASTAVFNGKLYVQQNAQKISAQQENHHILLSKSAQANSKPELEIYADDVKCQHGATTGQLDNEALFFMRSRGITKREATNILLQGFAYDVLRLIPCTIIKQHIERNLNLGGENDS